MHEREKSKWSRSVVSDSSRPHGLQSTRLLHPWDLPGKSTGVGCHCLLQCCSLWGRKESETTEWLNWWHSEKPYNYINAHKEDSVGGIFPCVCVYIHIYILPYLYLYIYTFLAFSKYSILGGGGSNLIKHHLCTIQFPTCKHIIWSILTISKNSYMISPIVI